MPTKRALTHYGIKGMHWGVRREDPTSGMPPEQNRVESKNGKITRVTVSRNTRENPNPAEDAAKAAVLKKRARTQSTDSLSNKELQDLVTRMNLEQQYTRLAQGSNTSAKKMVTDILLNQGKQEFNKFVQQQLTKQVASALQKK